MTVIPIVIGAIGSVSKGSVQGMDDFEITCGLETIQTTTLLRSVRILRRILETWGDLLSLKLQWKTISKCWCENLSRSNYHNNDNNNNSNNNNNNNNSCNNNNVKLLWRISLTLSLTIRLCLPSLQVGLLDYILCLYRAVVDNFKLVRQL